MKPIKEYLKTRSITYAVILIAGILLGRIVFSSGGHATHAHVENEEVHQEWTCSMHPQIRMDKPGKCPICGMDLIPVRSGGSGAADPSAIQLSEEAAALANVQTTRVERLSPVKELRLYGKIAPDERNLQSQSSHVSGRIERLAVDFTGETVFAGQTIATLYSPELFTAQEELLEAIRMQQPALVDAVRQKLRLWKMTDEQINTIESTGRANAAVEVKSNTSGVVISKRVNQGDYVQAGSVLLDVANLSRVWAMFEAYESDLPFLKKGDKVTFTLQALPGRTLSGNISFIDPLIDPLTRTARIRVEIANPGGDIKPGMYAIAEVSATLKGYKDEIVIPRSAILWTGKRSIVYVRDRSVDTPAFHLREVELGPELGGAYVVLNGLWEGEEIVTNGVFTIDSSAQLAGKRSMMNDNEGARAVTGHAGHGEHSFQTDAHVELSVSGSCEMCKERIEKVAYSVQGVHQAHWDLKSQSLHISYDTKKADKHQVSKAIATAGHDTELDKADVKTYQSLPACCQYRK